MSTETATAPRHLSKHKYDLPGSSGNARVTRAHETKGEYGHTPDCQHSIRRTQ